MAIELCLGRQLAGQHAQGSFLVPRAAALRGYELQQLARADFERLVEIAGELRDAGRATSSSG
jgi:hypothetical protein